MYAYVQFMLVLFHVMHRAGCRQNRFSEVYRATQSEVLKVTELLLKSAHLMVGWLRLTTCIKRICYVML